MSADSSDLRRFLWKCVVWVGCLVLAFVAGSFYSQVKDGMVLANSYANVEFMELGRADERAQNAYQHESPPVAIYAMKELLDRQKVIEQTGGNEFLSEKTISIDLMLTDARLAKLYAQTGQTNLSAEQVQEALRYAKKTPNLAVTNQDTLMDFLAKIDKGAR